MTMAQRLPQSGTGSAAFSVERLTGSIGAEISGLDLRETLSDATIDAVSAALVEHKVLFFRDQAISTEQHLAFGRRFGPLEIHPFATAQKNFVNDDLAPEVLVIESTSKKPLAADAWHSDVSFRINPSLASILRARVVPDVGGDTLWANMAAAYEGLDDATRSLISGLTAIHDWDIFRRGLYSQGVDKSRIDEWNALYPKVEHPVVRTHPVSGEKIIYVNTNFTIGIKGMKQVEADALLQRLYAQAAVPDYQVRFRWRPDSIAFWDNRSTQHYGTKDFFPRHRRMERVTIVGDRPF